MRVSSRFVAVLAVLGAVIVTGCATPKIANITPRTNVGDKTIVIGELQCYNNDEKVQCGRGCQVYLSKEGGEDTSILMPDREGYIYAALEEGQYNFDKFRRKGPFGDFMFNIEPHPTIAISRNDQIVNFGTVQYRFQQGTGSKVGAFLVGIGNAYLNVSILDEYAEVEQFMETKFKLKNTVTRRAPSYMAK